MVAAEDVLKFWLDECGPDMWYVEDAALDARIRERFYDTWEGVKEGRYSLWLTYPSGALAYIIVADQFSRNMFRDTREAFSMDRIGRAAAKQAIDKGWDLKIDEPARQFFYMPLMHSENLSDQDRCVRLTCERMTGGEATTLLHARAHRDVIRQFGRFPTRNAALSRTSSSAEVRYLEGGGYGEIVRGLQGSVEAA